MTTGAPEPADIFTSSAEYATRFAGPVGNWMLEKQSLITLAMVRSAGASTVLDVGGGHGQLAGPLCGAGYHVTVLGSTPACAERVKGLCVRPDFSFVAGSIRSLPFPDKSFDVVISFRLVCHCDEWPVLLGELCRVARKGVIIDYPTRHSINFISGALFGMKKKVEKNTRTFELFTTHQLDQVFRKSGFRLSSHAKQFFFPMVLHRMMKSVCLSRLMEGCAAAIGLNHLLGSPVIALWCPEEHANASSKT